MDANGKLTPEQLLAAGLEGIEDNPMGAFTAKRLTLAQLRSLPPKEWLLQGVFGKGDLAMVYGQPGSGKTFVVIDQIFSICLGRQWADRFEVDRPLTVAYCAGEGVSGLPGRFAAAAEYYGVDDLPNFHFFSLAPQLHDAFKGVDVGIAGFVAEWQVSQAAGDVGALDLLVIDTLHSATAGADENSAGDMGKVIMAAKWAAGVLGCAVMLVHHTTKNGDAYRGSSALHGAMDAMIAVKEIGDSGKFLISCAKLKDGEPWADQPFLLTEKGDSVRVWWSEPIEAKEHGDGKQSQDKDKILQILRVEGNPLTDLDITTATGLGRSTVRKLLAMMDEEGEVERSKQYPDKQKSNRNPWVYSLAMDEGES